MIQFSRATEPWNKGRKLPPEPLSHNEIERLLKSTGRGITGIRNKAMLVVMWRGGLRCQESLDLFPKDFDLEAGTIRVLRGKGNRSRLVGLDSGAVAIIQAWMSKRSSLGFNGSQTAFCTLQGGAVSSSYVRTMMTRLGKRAGIEKRVHAHGLRHSHASELAREGVGLHLIRQQLGHASLAVTDRYIASLEPVEVVQAMQSRVWG